MTARRPTLSVSPRTAANVVKVRQVSGEELHDKGREGARRAKEWLDATTRADVRWVNPDPVAVPKLTFTWADGIAQFSFDIGGLLLGGDKANQEFLAEVKNYQDASDQGTLYDEYLAKCYRAFVQRPDRCDNFFWVTWAPFKATTWSTLCAPEQLRSAVLKHRSLALGIDDEDQASQALDDDTDRVKAVADRLWLIVLSEKQERHLVLSKEHLAVVRHHITTKASA